MAIISGANRSDASIDGNMQYWKTVPYMETTAKDSTDTVGQAILNENGLIDAIAAQCMVTDSAATNSNLQLALMGSMDGTNWSNIVDSAGSNITSGSATDVTGANGGATTVVLSLDTLHNGRRRYPWKYLAVKALFTGANKGATFKMYVTVERSKSGRILV